MSRVSDTIRFLYLRFSPTRLDIGSRVRVRRAADFAGPWPSEPTGTVVAWPTNAPYRFRVVNPNPRLGPQRAFFVQFDEPQFDTDGPDGGGPYYKAEVWERYLERLPAGSASRDIHRR